ncbi:leucyl/phenylalanyl-tRNA--protein transferase [Paraburkholderia caballeronis]|uniref:Leucyl/phenylalanyl-tRNA--protein transferase n=1 Tax=Paraburkholderia caballeronis TaxID=416943 RepID=A0A1H7JXJ7_9BURK|nr:leucyl/phenylalanyl-tRNA--protein transferase [Paraburkholderia caballeronis]PXW27260.1 leucyl/phenylalanyl-tRNA--protein transferase [Paraburkholderia caballeronis]PXX02734.1 leucyl/phenylalanyl-tRNA--protein transferase [Paraburkholderia caballeronis]RAK03459.1 leucyl/phenylalanyl-tRNA--protein transferase [Paraburkholderia caballeronis]TDV36259.1 leucyl/phenylalanyl-tRNA--protein transferase [Paraburkholderia caballeronis]SEC39488.1 leucyl/phenylalanyl-tRNA--protein transferase [Paraburk
MVPWLGHDDPFPAVERALGAASGAPGLLAASSDLLPSRLLDAYRRGIFPWYSDGQPVLWWSPDPRMILRPDEFKVSPSLRKTLKRVLRDDAWEIRVDDDFRAVMRACAQAPRHGQRGTWITADVIDAYSSLHRAGEAHSIETWFDGERVGGLYGVSLGRMFFGESMFAALTDASKIALAALVAHLRRHGVELIDCQQNTSHLASLGGREIARRAFVAHVRATVNDASIPWRFDKSVLADLVRRQPVDPAA